MNFNKNILFFIIIIVITTSCFSSKKIEATNIENNLGSKSNAIISIETGHTIQKVRTANFNNKSHIIASSYEGIIMAIGYGGDILWKNKLSGFMNHDIWAADIDGDNNDEILVANADGNIYCLDYKGKLKWTFKTGHKNAPPMYAVTVVKKEKTSYVVCGGFDLSVYYVSSNGTLVKEIKSGTYSLEKTWGHNKSPSNLHYANFLRPVKKQDGTDMLAVHGNNNHMQVKGTLYLFDVLEDKPFKTIKIKAPTVIGEFRTSDYNKDGIQEILLGTSGHQNSMALVRVDLADNSMKKFDAKRLGFGYSVAQPLVINDDGEEKILLFIGNHIVLVDNNLSKKSEEKIKTTYSYNDIWKDSKTNKIILASSQSGGSTIHILDTENKNWKKEYKKLAPKGKLQTIINNTKQIRDNLSTYSKPVLERDPLPVYFMSSATDKGLARTTANNIKSNYKSPIFLGGSHLGHAENWGRSTITNEKYRKRRDRRRKYDFTQQQSIDYITKWYEGETGIAYWGGHGNDPYMFQRSTTEKIIDFANGKKTVLIFPELEDNSEDFAWVMDDFFYPLAEYSKTRNTNIFVRTKHNFWQANIYLPMWKKVLSGEYSNVFVPAMEETTDKAMDISIAGRTGIWASGAVNSWGTRAVPDNPSFDRARQFSHQRLPNHFMRHIIYHLANGAQYINNFNVDPDYMSTIWELIAKGALFVPKPNEIVSYSPVHLSMLSPDKKYLHEGSSLKWSTFYNQKFEDNNSFVFSRQNATWMAAPNTKWDFSSYAAGVKDRRQNYLPNYKHGLVLITPPQAGSSADLTATRGFLKDNLHPIYKNILKEYYTDGHYYYNADGSKKYNANEYYKTIKNDLKESEKLIPLTVTGDVAWVVAQTSPTNLRLTIIDGGYLNPTDKKAIIKFQSVKPSNIKDILDGKSFDISNSIEVDIPAGAYRFIDITLSTPLQ
ncbi:hypothetical protein OAJ14_04950 [Polaribacter sp.]|nr:hypothetical protein [Polaribacter sp.]